MAKRKDKPSDWTKSTVHFKVENKKVEFDIYHNIPSDGNINGFSAALDNWLARTSEYTDQSLVNYINSKGVHMAFTEKEWNDIN